MDEIKRANFTPVRKETRINIESGTFETWRIAFFSVVEPSTVSNKNMFSVSTRRKSHSNVSRTPHTIIYSSWFRSRPRVQMYSRIARSSLSGRDVSNGRIENVLSNDERTLLTPRKRLLYWTHAVRRFRTFAIFVYIYLCVYTARRRARVNTVVKSNRPHTPTDLVAHIRQPLAAQIYIPPFYGA